MKIDLTPIVQAAITLFAALVTYKLVPWLKTKVTEQQLLNLEAAAKIAVYAAEQMFGGDNKQKLEYAMKQVENAGFELDQGIIRAAVENAVYALKEDKYLTNGFLDPDDEE